jgi:LmbE family N-acetylglucosaminyl deacetylase
MGAVALGVFSPKPIPILIAMLIANLANAAEAPAQPNSAQIQLALRKLGVVGSVLYVAAHPDDENTNLLAYLSNERLLRTAYLSLTRGDGGQNLIGSEQGVDLGVIRTQELLAARRIDGAEQYFTRARDFGYSKNPDETLRIWGKDAVLADVVYAIRRFRPDVIVTRFSPLPSDTHGHHTASAQLALEAFRAAADPGFHPEQLRDGVAPWQARRIYWNRSWWSIKPGEDLSDFIKLDVNGYSPLLGLSYGEMAAESRSMHKSQGFGVERSRGPIVEYFKLLATDQAEPAAAHGVLDGLELTWKRLKGTVALAALIQKAQAGFVATAPAKSLPIFLQIDKALDGVPDASWREKKKAAVRDLLVACAGLFVEVTAAEPRVVPGDALEVTFSAINRSPATLRLRDVRVVGAKLADAEADLLSTSHMLGSVALKARLRTATDLPLSTPHWLALAPEPGLFRVADPASAIAPVLAPALEADFVFELDGHAFSVRRPITYKWTDPVAGERYRPVEVLPRVAVQPRTATLVLPNGEERPLVVRLSGTSAPVSGTLAVEAPAGWTVTPPTQRFSLAGHGAESDLGFKVQPASHPISGTTSSTASGTLRVVATVGDARFEAAVVHLEHDHIPSQVVLHSSDVRVVSFPIDRQIRTVGYVPGPGDEVAPSLRQAGYDVRTILDDGLSPGALKDLAVVVIGVRAFNTSAKVRAAQPVLMAYVQDGGTVVAQYNTNNRLAPLSTPIGPFPFEIGSERVTDEMAAVTFTAPTHRLLTWPNRIGVHDFDGWVQERGLYFAKTWDSHYETVLRMNDPGEHALDGSVLFARHGKGVFVYTGLSFFRELPAGVPGAFRLFANLLAAGQGQPGH